MTLTPTAEQAAILDAYRTGEDLVIQAGAGTGKTSTLRMIANLDLGKPWYGTYLAFNKSIATEAKNSFPQTVRSQTAHSLAFQAVGKPYEKRLKAPRAPFQQVVSVLNIRDQSYRLPDGTTRMLTAAQLARHVMDTVTEFCHTADREISTSHVPVITGLDSPALGGGKRAGENHQRLIEYIFPRAKQAWAELQQTEGVLRYSHDIYLKSFQLTNPLIGGQYLMFDEAQDSNPVVAAIVDRQEHLQRVYVGDQNQAIYGFTGARDRMQELVASGLTTLPLTQSFRFGPAIAAAANRLLVHLRSPMRLSGFDKIGSALATLDAPGGTRSAAVLTRTNAGSLGEVIRSQEAGRRVHLVGGSDDVRRFVTAALELQTRYSTFHPELMAFSSWGQVQDYVANDPSGSDLSLLVGLVDEYTAPVLLRALERCVPEPQADLIVSTAHKAKGREWPSVRIASDFTLSDEEGKPPSAEELMLAYVAVTRAQETLDPGELAQWVGFTRSQAMGTAAPAMPPVVPVVVPSGGDQVEVGSAPLADEAVERDLRSEDGRVISVPGDVWSEITRLAAAQGIDPEEFAMRVLRGVVAAFAPPVTFHHQPG